MSPGFGSRLTADLKLVRSPSVTELQLRGVAKNYNVQLRPKISFDMMRTRLQECLKELGASSPVNSCCSPLEEPQGSTLNPLFGDEDAVSPLPKHRLSYSQAVSPAAKGSGSKLLVLGSVAKPHRSPLTQAAGALQEASPRGGRAVVTAEMTACPAAPSQVNALLEVVASLEQRLQQSDARVEALAAQVAQQGRELANLRTALGNQKQALQTCSSTALGAAQGVDGLRGAVECLQGEAARTQQLERHVSHVQSQQMKLAEQQQMGECQRSIIFKTPTPLPSQGSKAEAAGVELGRLLQQKVTVLRAQLLQGRFADGSGSSGSQECSQRRLVYRLLLSSSEARDAVMRCKAQKLRGTAVSITACLTAGQQARMQALRPAAADAKRAGQRVQWRYDRLFIDGAEHKGEARLAGSSPLPSASRGPSRGPAPAASAPAPAPVQPEGEEEGEWREVPTRKGKQQQQRREQPTVSPPSKPRAGAAGGKALRGSGAAPLQAQKSKQPGAAAHSYAAAARRVEAPGKENSASAGQGSESAKGARLPRPAPTNLYGGAQRSSGSQQELPQQRPPSPPLSPTRA